MQFGAAAGLDDSLDTCDGLAFKLDQIRLRVLRRADKSDQRGFIRVHAFFGP